MKVYAVTIALLALASLSACTTHPEADPFCPWIFPTAVFVEDGTTSFEQDLRAMENATRQHFPGAYPGHFDFAAHRQEFCRMFGTNETERMLADPFLCRTYEYVRFDTFTPSQEILHYYDTLFTDDGWRTQRREVIMLEAALTGGDAVRVYAKDAALVRLHVFGPLVDPAHNSPDDLTVWQFELSFLGMDPEVLLSGKYRLKGTEILSPNYHFGMVIQNHRETEKTSNKDLEATR